MKSVNVVGLSNLVVVGYGDVLMKQMLPTTVPPIFRLCDDTDRFFVPPYFLSGNFLVDSTEISFSQIKSCELSKKITLFDPFFPARSDYILWIDSSFKPHYEHRCFVKSTLNSIFDESLVKAVDALKKRDFEVAREMCNIMTSIDDRRIEPFAISACVKSFDLNDNDISIELKQLEGIISSEPFMCLVQFYKNMVL